MNRKAKEYASLLEAMNDGFCMILEVYKDKQGIKLNESQANVPEGMMRVTGVAAKIGVKNRNGRIYNAENYRKHLNELQKAIPSGLYGELEHPEGFTINNNNISHKIEAVWFDEATNEIKITILLLDTPKGKIAQSIIKSGGALKVSSRARGFVNKNSEAIIDELITYDIVGTPGFAETELYLSEHRQKVASDMLSESYVVYNKHIEDISENININSNQMKTNQQKNQELLQKHLKQSQQKQVVESIDLNFLNGPFANQIQTWLHESYAPAIQEWLHESYAPAIQEWLHESFATALQDWIVKDFAPIFESYLKRKAINESRGKTAISFPVFVEMQSQINESKQQQLSQEEQQALQKMQEGQQLENGEIVLAQQALDKLQQQQQKQKLQQQQQQEKVQEGLTLSEKRAFRKLQEGQQLENGEIVLAQKALDKLQQQQQKQQDLDEDECDDDDKDLKEALEMKANRINRKLRNNFRKLMESQDDDDKEQINQEISDLQAELQETQEKIDELEEDNGDPENGDVVLENQQQQKKLFQQALQKVQDGDELTEDDLDGLTQTQIEQIMNQCSTNESEIPTDEDDRKVLDEDENELPTQDEEKGIKETLLEQKSGKLLEQSGNLLKAIQMRMNESSIGKKK